MKRLSLIPILRVFRPAPYFCALSRNGSPFPAFSTTLFTIVFRNSQLPRSYGHVSRSAAQPRHSSTPLLPTFEFPWAPRPPQPRPASLKSLYRKRANTLCSCVPLADSRFRYNTKTSVPVRRNLLMVVVLGLLQLPPIRIQDKLMGLIVRHIDF